MIHLVLLEEGGQAGRFEKIPGAGGIGQDLIEAIRKFYYSDVSAILLLLVFSFVVLACVYALTRKPWSVMSPP